jgi:hypothetical protein
VAPQLYIPPICDCRDANYNCDAREEVVSPNRQELCGQQSTGHQVVRLRDRSNSIERIRAQPWILLCSRLRNAVYAVWDAIGYIAFGSLGIVVHSWSDCHRSGMVE